MERDVNKLIVYINSEWAQSMSNANQKIANLIMDNEALYNENQTVHEENENLKSEIIRLKNSNKMTEKQPAE